MSSVLTSMFHAEVRLSSDVCGRASTPMVECRPPEGHLGHCTGTSTSCGCASPDVFLMRCRCTADLASAREGYELSSKASEQDIRLPYSGFFVIARSALYVLGSDWKQSVCAH